MAFTLSKRVHKILDKMLSPEQTAYVKNRFIDENIRQMHDIIDYAYKMKILGIILFFQFSKSFWFFGMEFHVLNTKKMVLDRAFLNRFKLFILIPCLV